MDTSFHDLMSRLDSGESDAQTDVFQRFSQRLVKLARARLDDRGESADQNGVLHGRPSDGIRPGRRAHREGRSTDGRV